LTSGSGNYIDFDGCGGLLYPVFKNLKRQRQGGQIEGDEKEIG
jgi:hypothetical protein